MYRCRTCGGFYKHRYAARLEARHFDAEGGWFTTEDVCLKVGEILSSTARFTSGEAHLYGFRGSDDPT